MSPDGYFDQMQYNKYIEKYVYKVIKFSKSTLLSEMFYRWTSWQLYEQKYAQIPRRLNFLLITLTFGVMVPTRPTSPIKCIVVGRNHPQKDGCHPERWLFPPDPCFQPATTATLQALASHFPSAVTVVKKQTTLPCLPRFRNMVGVTMGVDLKPVHDCREAQWCDCIKQINIWNIIN